MTKLTLRFKGGKGSGDFGHKGRPGEVGGSGEGETSNSSEKAEKRINYAKQKIKDYVASHNDWKMMNIPGVVGMKTVTPVGNVLKILAMGGSFMIRAYGDDYGGYGNINEAVRRAKEVCKWMDKKDTEAGIKQRTGIHSYIMNDGTVHNGKNN